MEVRDTSKLLWQRFEKIWPSQIALLAGISGSNQYDPYTNPEAATQRRNLVLSEMWTQIFLSPEQYPNKLSIHTSDDGLQSLKIQASYPAYG